MALRPTRGVDILRTLSDDVSLYLKLGVQLDEVTGACVAVEKRARGAVAAAVDSTGTLGILCWVARGQGLSVVRDIEAAIVVGTATADVRGRGVVETIRRLTRVVLELIDGATGSLIGVSGEANKVARCSDAGGRRTTPGTDSETFSTVASESEHGVATPEELSTAQPGVFEREGTDEATEFSKAQE